MSKRNTITIGDFFAGIGGLRLGFQQSGYKIVYSNDNGKRSCETYRANFRDIDERDIREVDVDVIPNFDVLIAGFPCQPFSVIGKRKGLKDDRGKLFFELVRILAVKKPRAILLENVRHLIKHDGGKSFERIKQSLELLGYKVFWQILSSADFGVPQRRERLYIAGFLDHGVDFKFPIGKKTTKLKDILEHRANEQFYLSEKYYKGLLAHKKRHAKQGSGFGCEILDPNGMSHTLVAGNMGRERNLIRDVPVPKNRWGVRRLTVKECARLQGFPESFEFPVPMTAAYEQLGNAVTVAVSKAIAAKIKKLLPQSVIVNNKLSPQFSPSPLKHPVSTIGQETSSA
ncbi:MAG: DNA (cytosine-5-)-methyltransferase [Candidatus Yanofskybacteria bacterium]|nr:DNA (cytosine-5-)-methyltransferase [Candidatus Yanofskybacteria bacterium]